MALTLDDAIGTVRASRTHFLKHLDGLRDDQWDWKPYPECKTIRETLAHLIQDDRAALDALKSGGEPDYESFAVEERDPARLRAMLDASHEAVCSFLQAQYADASLDTVASFFGEQKKLGVGIPFLGSEDYYHAGQVAFIRLATDPGWDYYASIYGGD